VIGFVAQEFGARRQFVAAYLADKFNPSAALAETRGLVKSQVSGMRYQPKSRAISMSRVVGRKATRISEVGEMGMVKLYYTLSLPSNFSLPARPSLWYKNSALLCS
jgi:hypothetical protein